MKIMIWGKRYRRWLSGVLVACIAFSATTAAIGANGKGKVKPYDLQLSALMNADNSVDLYVGVSVNDAYTGSFGLPNLSKHVQLKSFDLAGDLRWTKNYQDETLTANGAVAEAVFTYTDMLYRQPVKAQIQVQTAETTDTEVLRNTADVLLRPDLAVTQVSAPAENTVSVPFDVVATLNELNKDVGATADVVLYNGGTELMRMPAAAVNTAGPTVVNFEGVNFDVAGTYTLTVALEAVRPGDYDTSNNTADVTVVIVDAYVAVDSQLYFYHQSTAYSAEWDNYYSKGTQDDTWVFNENTVIYAYAGSAAEFDLPVDLSYRVDANGAVFATDDLLGLGRTGGWYYYDYHSSQIAPGQWVAVIDYDQTYCSGCRDYAVFQNYAYYYYYQVRKEDTDGDGILETIYDTETNYYSYYGKPVAGKDLPTSIDAELAVTSGGTTYLGAVSASGAELVDLYPGVESSYENGVRGQNYYRYSYDYRYIYLNKTNSAGN